MKKIIVHKLMLLCFVNILQGQISIDTILLPEVILMENRLACHSIGSQIDTINIALTAEGSSSDLSSVISSLSNVFVKRYGALATPTFRGTSSSHTLILWNGIPLNSLATGLSDLYSINTHNFTNVILVNGGNSSIFGSGALGGSIHLNSNLESINKNEISFSKTIGSYGLNSESVTLFLTDKKLSAKVSLQSLIHANNFDYINTTQIGSPEVSNEYGKIKSTNNQIDVHYKLNSNTNYTFNYWDNQYEREVPQNMTTPFSDAKQYDKYKRVLFTLKHKINYLSIRIKQAYLQEDFRYTEVSKNINSYFLAESYISDADIKFITGNYLLNIGGMFINNNVNNKNYISNYKKERSLAVFSSFQYKSKLLSLNSILRKEWQTTFEVPTIPTIAMVANLNSNLKIRTKFNRNFRSPTFNDRFWIGASSYGNPKLKAEDAWNKEFGFDFTKKNIKFSATAYTLNISNMILWQQNESGSWTPINLQKVCSRGIEIKSKIKINYLSIESSFAYTKSTNESKTNNLDNTIGEQLRYVPIHKGNINFLYSMDNLQFSLNTTYTGEVITSHSIDKNKTLDSFTLSNFAIQYNFEKIPIIITGKINNLLNKTYITYENYPNARREILLTLNYTIN